MCGNINWGNDVAIGFKGEDIFFENYELGGVNFTDIDCISPPITFLFFDLTPDVIPRQGQYNHTRVVINSHSRHNKLHEIYIIAILVPPYDIITPRTLRLSSPGCKYTSVYPRGFCLPWSLPVSLASCYGSASLFQIHRETTQFLGSRQITIKGCDLQRLVLLTRSLIREH